MMLGWWNKAVLGGLAMCAVACSDDGSSGNGSCVRDGKIDYTAQLAVQDKAGAPLPAAYSIDIAGLAQGSVKTVELQIRNTAPALTASPLFITSVQLIETDNLDKPVSDRHFACVGPDGKACEDTTWAALVPPGFDSGCTPSGAASSQAITLRYTRATKAEVRRAKLAVTFKGDVKQGTTPWTLTVTTRLGTPKLTCTPNPLDFGAVSLGAEASSSVACYNAGTADATIAGAQMLGSLPVRAQIGDYLVSANQPMPVGAVVTVPPDKNLIIPVQLDKVQSEQKATAFLRLLTNDPSKDKTPDPAQYQLDLKFQANASGPCVNITPPTLDFGEKAVGVPSSKEVQIESCGAEDLAITGVEFTGGPEQGFAAGFGTSCFAGKAPTPEAPQPVLKALTCSLLVVFTPTKLGATSSAQMIIHTTAGDRTVGLTGKAATSIACPKACLAVKMVGGAPVTGQVIPQSPLQFDASCSKPANDNQPVVKYKWTVTQPTGSYSTLTPSDTVKAPQFTPNSAGKYTISLEVQDSIDVKSCSPATYELLVVPDDKIHIELTWDTPGDPDKTDSGDPITGKKPDGKFAGTDMDLHLAHPEASEQPGQKDFDKNGEPDPWFAPCYDVNVLNSPGIWDDLGDYDDDARLDLDDKDGWGPENINLSLPPPAQFYTVGVYYWDEHGLGPSTPTVRIYLDGKATAVATKTGPPMADKDMWCAARVSWQPSQVQPCKGADAQGNLVTKKYPLPSQFSLKCK